PSDVMLQRVSFSVAGAAVEGILHLPEVETIGGVLELGGRVSDIEAGRFVCEALAAAGVAALRFAYRTASDIQGNLADRRRDPAPACASGDPAARRHRGPLVRRCDRRDRRGPGLADPRGRARGPARGARLL